MVRFTRAGVALTVGIILLTGLVIGGLFWAKEQGEQARRDEAILIAEATLTEDSTDEGVALNDGEESTESEESTTEEAITEETTTDETTSEEVTTEGATGSDSEVAADQLPATGAGDALPIVGAGLLALSAVAYSRSRRGLSGTL